MDPASFSLPRGSRILVTGGNGYIASHVIDKLLEIGFVVRGTVRAEKPWLSEYFHQKYGENAFETVLVTSFDDINTVERALNDVDGVIHLASNVSFSGDPNAIIPWVVKATLNILEIASRKQCIRRVVLVSSSTASYMILPDPRGREVFENSWNNTAVAAAWDDQTPVHIKGVSVYAASKTEGERQSWKWIEDHSPHYAFNTILPCYNVGRILHPEIPGSTMGAVRQLLRGDSSTFAKFTEQWYVDVEDVARLCVISLLDFNVQSERIFAFAEQSHLSDTVSVLRELRPQNRSIPDAQNNIPRDNTVIHPRHRAESLLQEFYGQSRYTPIRESISRGIEGWE